MILLVLLIILLLASLLTIFKAPTYHLWLLAIAVTEFPLLFIGIIAVLLAAVTWADSYRLASLITGMLAIILYLSPIVRSYAMAKDVKAGFAAAFGSGSTAINGDNDQPLFSLGALFKRADRSVQFNTLVYDDAGQQTLDFYPSRLGGKRPCVVVVHGGSWSSGDSQQLPELNTYLANAGYNVASVNYHLAPNYRSPVAVDDVGKAFDYLRQYAADLRIDTGNFVILGRSAGAQIALLFAYTRAQPGLKGVIDFYGPADMVWGYSKPASKLVMDSRAVMERYLGGTYAEVPKKYFESSPIEFVNRQTPPTLILHGDNDVLVSPVHSQKLDHKLAGNNVKHYYLRLPWATHGFDYTLNGPGGQLSTYLALRFINTVCR